MISTRDQAPDALPSPPTAIDPRPITGGALRDAVLQRYVHRRRRAADQRLDDDPDYAAEPARVGHPVALACLARLARTIGDMPDPSIAATEGRVLLVRTDDPADRTLPSLLSREVLPTLADLLDRRSPRSELVVETSWTKSGAGEWSLAQDDLARIMSAGHLAMIACGSSRIPPDEIADLLDAEVAVPDLSPEDVVAMLKAVDRPGWDDPALLDQLPSTDCLATLGPLHLAYAWAATDADGAVEVARRLSRATARMEARAAQQAEAKDGAAPDGEAEDRDVPDLRLADLHGLGDAADLLRRIVEDVADWRDAHLDWSDVGASVLLSGPPGVGKTSIASALAGEIGGPVVDLSYTTLQAAGHLGQMLGALDKGVAKARSEAPCVVLIDECDDLANRRGGDAFAHGTRYMRSTVNAYLQRLTELANAEGIVVVLATNYPDLVDPALSRAGRVDHHVRLHLPDRAALGAILEAALGDHVEPDLAGTDEWSAALDALTGGSGADATQLARDLIAAARVRARREPKAQQDNRPRIGRIVEVGSDDLAEAVAQRVNPWAVTPDLHRLAVHEAGHIVTGYVLQRPDIRRAWVSHRGAGVMSPVEGSHTLRSARAELACLFAGRSAERILLGCASSGAGAGGRDSDLAKASTLAARIASEWHLETTDAALVWRSAERHVEAPAWSDRRTAEAVERLLLDAQARADALITAHREVVEHVAEALVRERELDGGRIAALLADVPQVGSGT